MNGVFLTVPKAVYGKQDLLMYVSTNVAKSYQAALAGGGASGLGANGFNNQLNVGEKPMNFNGVEIVMCPGMSDNKIVAAQKSNLFFGTGLLSDYNTVKVIDIPASTDGHVLRRSGTVLGFGQIVAAGIADGSITLAKIADNAVGDSKLRQSAGFSVIGRNQSTTGNVADISTPASSGYYVLGLQNTFFGWQDKLRLKGFVNTADNEYSATNVTFNTGAGTGPTLDAIDGSYNSFYIRFTTGTSPAANSTVFKVTFPYSVSRARVTFSALTATSAAQMTNFYTSRFANQVEIYVSTALPASTQYELSFIIALG